MRSPISRSNATPISRPKSRHKFTHRPIAVAMGIFIATAIGRNSFCYLPCCLPIVVASVFSKLVTNRIAPDTHRDQACRDVTHDCPGGHCRPRETLVPDEVQWVSQNRGCCLRNASQWWLIAWATRSSANSGWNKGKTQSKPWLFTSRVTGLVPLAPPFSQSSGLSQMACAPEACDSRHVPACVPVP